MVKQLDIWKAIEKLNYNPRKLYNFSKFLDVIQYVVEEILKIKKTQIKKEEEQQQQQQQIEDVSGYISPFDNPIIHSGKHKKRHLKQ